MLKVTSHGGSPVTLTEVKYQLKLEDSFTDDDNLLQIMMDAATQSLEAYCNSCFVTSTVEEVFDKFKRITCLGRSPLISVTSVEYYTSGSYSTQSSSEYIVDTYSKPGRIQILDDYAIPSTDNVINRQKVTYQSGYGAIGAVPDPIKQAVLVLVTEMYERRENFVKRLPDYVQDLVRDYRYSNLGRA